MGKHLRILHVDTYICYLVVLNLTLNQWSLHVLTSILMPRSSSKAEYDRMRNSMHSKARLLPLKWDDTVQHAVDSCMHPPFELEFIFTYPQYCAASLLFICYLNIPSNPTFHLLRFH